MLNMAAPLCLGQVMNSKWNLILQKRCYSKKLNYITYANQCPQFIATTETVPYDTGAQDTKIGDECIPPCTALYQNQRLSEGNVKFHGFCKPPQDTNNEVLYMEKSDRFRKGINKPYFQTQMRWNSGWDPNRKLPTLMDFPEIVWPSVLKTLKNRILASFIITPYFDRQFRLSDFVYGSKQALEVVSDCLAKGDCSSLNGLVTDDAMLEVKKNISRFSEAQRRELKIEKEDVYFAFPYQIGIMFNEDEKNQKRFVEITMVFHVLRGLQNLRAQDVNPPLNLGLVPEYQDKLQLCNYRFIREFTKGVESDWTINLLNHFKPVDRINS